MPGGPAPSALREVVKFAAAAFAVLAVLAIGVALILRDISEDEAIDDAERVTEVVARTALEPAVDRGLLRRVQGVRGVGRWSGIGTARRDGAGFDPALFL